MQPALRVLRTADGDKIWLFVAQNPTAKRSLALLYDGWQPLDDKPDGRGHVL